MVNSKDFLEGFLQYLQQYYGGKQYKVATNMPNLVKLPLFQESTQEMPELAPPQPQQQGMSMDPMGMAQQLNGMFPGPYDPMRMN